MSLVVQDLSKKYGTRTVVDHLSFEMNRPGVYALLGTNGAGKTTSIRMMLGMLSRDSGTVTWNGKPLDINNCNVGYLAEERGLYPKYTIMDQLMYFAALRGVSASEAKKRIHYSTGQSALILLNIFIRRNMLIFRQKRRACMRKLHQRKKAYLEAAISERSALRQRQLISFQKEISKKFR